MPITANDVLRVFEGAKIVSEPRHIGASLTDLFQTIKKGGIVELTITKVLADKVREYQGRLQWPVITLQYGEKNWVTLDCPFQPNVGSTLDCSVTEKPNPKGGTYKNARYMGQPPQQAQQASPSPTPQPASTPVKSDPSAPVGGYTPPAKIKWEDWERVASRAWGFAVNICNMPPAEAVAFVNTTLITFSNRTLDTPAALPQAGREPGDDDDDIPEFLK